jgi:hypothetical protein
MSNKCISWQISSSIASCDSGRLSQLAILDDSCDSGRLNPLLCPISWQISSSIASCDSGSLNPLLCPMPIPVTGRGGL